MEEEEEETEAEVEEASEAEVAEEDLIEALHHKLSQSLLTLLQLKVLCAAWFSTGRFPS